VLAVFRAGQLSSMGISKELQGKKTLVVSASNIQLLLNASLMEVVYNEIWVTLN
jgi:hypothetical protein